MSEIGEGNEQVVLQQIGLRYVSCNDKGYCRVAEGKHFRYLDHKGNEISNETVLKRIQTLVLPPAWTDVWICANANGHLQATGVDVRGRKQYRYHAKWTSIRSEKKFTDLHVFGAKLPLLKKAVLKDLRKRSLSREKVCAVAVSVMQKTSFRAGNSIYQKTNGSYGLTTLKNKHVKQISTNKLFFKFVGKKGVVQQTYLQEKTLIKMLLKVKDLPGQRIFQYVDDEGEIRALESGDINGYLKEVMGINASCKSFRTWNACLMALKFLIAQPVPVTVAERKKNVLAVIDQVAAVLGNTRAVTRSHYIHPSILEAYENAELNSWIGRMKKKETDLDTRNLEKKLLQILKAKI
ncbi:DNA topoisomerase IB [Sphingobacterium deserti]|uniref:DNA topoisomerase n=1 Tax=Sphingobacterium deserti TaxID=1229276 RepID=A0A0B8SYR1_9SPHI|nr:DNA topoisomerase IB [Sphingobacterium deserti]KGE12537.1 DNA topoisomerase [Sphingobacterium deserti]